MEEGCRKKDDEREGRREGKVEERMEGKKSILISVTDKIF